VEIPPLTEGQQTKLTCTAPGLCSGSRPEITWTWRGKGESNSQITGNITEFHTKNLSAVTQRHSSTLTFNLSSEHHGTTITCEVRFACGTTRKTSQTLNVKYKRKLQIIGNTTVPKGSDLSLTCSVESFPPAVIMWSKPSAHRTHLLNNTGSASLVISNATAEDSGQYTCTATYLNQKETAQVDVTVTCK
ncbi:sialic acid-binding Ig-like lectin 5, partial [Austrofundulus limnaeus]|uniref:Sialic acid-binding Ig-like lectin 5 n=1 Tax=Austrofundulus limnaeus TaxID=52670 RepID=A0A2I4ALC3_AUSLI